MQLRDMEELLHKIINPVRKDYMKEALSCYQVGANRACIVLSVIAMVDDLYEKVKALSLINGDANTILQDIDMKKAAQQTFEQDLIDQLCSKGLLTKLDATISTQLKTLRHKAAHPSGHVASAEEARYVFSAVIDNVLSKELKHTMQLVHDIIHTLDNNGNYFPEYRFERTSSIAINKIEHLHEDAYTPLIKKLFEKAIIDKHSNSYLFIISLRNFQNQVFQEKLASEIQNYASNDEAFLLFPFLFSESNNLLKKIKENQITLERLNSLFLKHQNTADFTSFPTAMTSEKNKFFFRNADTIKEFELFTYFESSLKNYLNKYKFNMEIEIWKIPEAKTILLEIYNENLKSNPYPSSNDVATFLKNGGLSEIEITDQEAFDLCESLEVAATNGAFTCKGIVNTYYNDIPTIKSKVLNYLEENSGLTPSSVGQRISSEEPEEDTSVDENKNEEHSIEESS